MEIYIERDGWMDDIYLFMISVSLTVSHKRRRVYHSLQTGFIARASVCLKTWTLTFFTIKPVIERKWLTKSYSVGGAYSNVSPGQISAKDA